MTIIKYTLALLVGLAAFSFLSAPDIRVEKRGPLTIKTLMRGGDWAEILPAD